MLNNHAVDRAFHALAEPTRRAIIDKLSRGPISVSELAEPFDMTLAAIVQHLQVLEESGMVRTEKVGRVRTCRIEPSGLKIAAAWLDERRATWERRFDRLGEMFAAEESAARKKEPHQDKEIAMSREEIVHSTFTIERTFPVPPARVFQAFADPSQKRRWYADEDRGPIDSHTSDFRIGGFERTRFRFKGSVAGGPPAGSPMGNDTVYVDIVENERIVFAYVMLVGDRRMSASLATIVLEPAGRGTRLTFTEQSAFFAPADGPELRKAGWTALLEKVGSVLA